MIGSKATIYQEDITILNFCAPRTCAPISQNKTTRCKVKDELWEDGPVTRGLPQRSRGSIQTRQLWWFSVAQHWRRARVHKANRLEKTLLLVLSGSSKRPYLNKRRTNERDTVSTSVFMGTYCVCTLAHTCTSTQATCK